MFGLFPVTHRISYLDSLISSSANAIHSVAPTTIQTIASANVNLFKVLGLIASLICRAVHFAFDRSCLPLVWV